MTASTIPVVPAGTTDHVFTTSDGAEIPFRVKGTGPSLVMIPGWSQSGAMFAHQLAGLSDRFRVIVPDIRGQGAAAPPPGGLRMARLAVDLAELIAHLELDRPNLLGWSMGASVLWAYVDQFGTGAVERLVFVDQPASLMIAQDMDEEDRISAGAMFTFPGLDQLCADLRGAGGEGTRAAFVEGMVTRTIPADLLAWIKAENAQTPTGIAAALLASHCMQDWRDVLPRIDRPSLVIGGAVSHVDPRSQRAIHACIAGSRYHEFGAEEGGAHYPFLEAPAAFNRVVAEFLAGAA